MPRFKRMAAVALACLFSAGPVAAQSAPAAPETVPLKKSGHFQFSIHSGTWTLNLLKGVFEGLAVRI